MEVCVLRFVVIVLCVWTCRVDSCVTYRLCIRCSIRISWCTSRNKWSYTQTQEGIYTLSFENRVCVSTNPCYYAFYSLTHLLFIKRFSCSYVLFRWKRSWVSYVCSLYITHYLFVRCWLSLSVHSDYENVILWKLSHSLVLAYNITVHVTLCIYWTMLFFVYRILGIEHISMHWDCCILNVTSHFLLVLSYLCSRTLSLVFLMLRLCSYIFLFSIWSVGGKC